MKVYDPDQVCGFRFTRDKWGPFSNFSNHRVELFGVTWKNSEALYQAARFPTHRDLQTEILKAPNAAAAKSIAVQNYPLTVEDWDKRKVHVMFITVLAKRQYHHPLFSKLFAETEGKTIVEISKKDDYWGAKPLPNGNLMGANVLGNIWTIIRDAPWMLEAMWIPKYLDKMPFYNPNTLDQFDEVPF